jgi:peptidoglycan hydrolase-like protein with peptidoglycan-binding domain
VADDDRLRSLTRSIVLFAEQDVDVEKALDDVRRRLPGVPSETLTHRPRRRIIVAVAAGALLVFGAGAVGLSRRGDPGQIAISSESTMAQTPTSAPPSGSAVPTTGRRWGAVIEPSLAHPGATITVTPVGPVERICTNIVTIARPTTTGLVLEGQILTSGEWVRVSAATPPTWPTCTGDTTAEPMTVSLPTDIAGGEHVVCIATEDDAAGCGELTVTNIEPPVPTVTPRDPEPCDSSVIEQDLGIGPTVVDDRCDGTWAVLDLIADDSSNDLVIVHRVDGRWAPVHTSSARGLCARDLGDRGAPAMVIDAIDWPCWAFDSGSIQYRVEPGTGDLTPGDVGPRVRSLQAALVREGHLPTGADDGEFGPSTRSALIAHQLGVGSFVTGIADISTIRALGADAVFAEFPPQATALTHGGIAWAVVLAAADVGSPSPSDPAASALLDTAEADARAAGYVTGRTDCDFGAAEAWGVPQSEGDYVLAVSVPFDSERAARAAAEAFADRGVDTVVAEVQTMCMD